MSKVIDILMRRDGLTKSEAEKLVDEAREVMLQTGDDEAMMDILGLEPDYLMDVLLG